MSIRQDLEAEEKMVRETPKYRLEDLLDDAIQELKDTIKKPPPNGWGFLCLVSC